MDIVRQVALEAFSAATSPEALVATAAATVLPSASPFFLQVRPALPDVAPVARKRESGAALLAAPPLT
jgi:hypothetical protein